MSVKLGLMVLLGEGPKYGAQLKSEFEARTNGMWPLNVGQVYTTLARLERDGLVLGAGEPDEEGRIPYRLTEAGEAEVSAWWGTPTPRGEVPRDELAIKLALAASVPGLDVAGVIQGQRRATLAHLQRLTQTKRQGPPGTTASEAAARVWRFVIERAIYEAQAEAQWLDFVERAVRQNNSDNQAGG